MANVVVHLEPGTFYAGINRPWYASQTAVRTALHSDFGFGAVTFHNRSVPLPAAVRAKLTAAELADKGWDEWLEATYSGPRKDVPHSKQWSWLVEPSSKPPAAPAPKPSPAPARPAPRPPAAPPALPAPRPAPWAPWGGGQGTVAPVSGAMAPGLALLAVVLGGWFVLKTAKGR